MCVQDKKIHFCTCGNKKEVSLDITDEIRQLYDQEYMKSWTATINKDGTYLNKYFKWTLSKYNEKETKTHTVMGMVIYPTRSLNKLLTEESVLELLNSMSAFDFEYEPEELDTFSVEESYEFIHLKEHERPHLSNFMSFIYENGQWIFGQHPLAYLFDKIKIGRIQTRIDYSLLDLKGKTDLELMLLINAKLAEIKSNVFDQKVYEVNSAFKNVFLISQFCMKMKNGGFEYLFKEQNEEWLSSVNNCFYTIKAEEHIKIFDQAKAHYNNKYKSNKFRADAVLFDLNVEYFDLAERLTALVANYIRENYEAFLPKMN